MKIPYRKIEEYIPVDINKLRPKSSYDKLMAKRIHPIEELIKKHGKIPEELLITRVCPTCGSREFVFEFE